MVKRGFLFLGVLVAVGYFVAGCSKASEDLLKPSAPVACDTTDMQYARDILPILQANCYSCHGNGSTGGSGGISLDGYDKLKVWADNGILEGNITHANGYVPMPYNAAKLPDCEINKIIAWINSGALNN